MSKISIVNVEVLNNPAYFTSKFSFKITFECIEHVIEDLEWKLIYVGSAYNEKMDQVLDSVLVGPIPVGRHQFVFDTDAPNPDLIPVDDVVGVTVVLLQSFYRNQEFVRIGFFVSNEYDTEELRDNSPDQPILAQLQRHIKSDDPRITRFAINWDDDETIDQSVPGVEEKSIDEEMETHEPNAMEDTDEVLDTVVPMDDKENEGVEETSLAVVSKDGENVDDM